MKNALDRDLPFYFKKMEELYLHDEDLDISGVIKMAIDVGGTVEDWFVHLDPEKCRATRTPSDTYNVTLSMTKDVFVKTFLGTIAMEEAYNNGLVIVEGDVDFAAFLIICFPRPYPYDSWLYHLEGAVVEHRARDTSKVYKLEIENTIQRILDDDVDDPIVVAPAEPYSTRFVMVDGGKCRITPETPSGCTATIDVRLRDRDLLDFIQGTITVGELALRSPNNDSDLSARLSSFTVFAIRPMPTAD